jgi:hypothetical protein
MTQHTELWREKDARNPRHQNGVEVEESWLWYEAWMSAVRKYCEDHEPRYKPKTSVFAIDLAVIERTA